MHIILCRGMNGSFRAHFGGRVTCEFFLLFFFVCVLYCAEDGSFGAHLGGESDAISFYCFFWGSCYIVQRMGRFLHI